MMSIGSVAEYLVGVVQEVPMTCGIPYTGEMSKCSKNRLLKQRNNVQNKASESLLSHHAVSLFGNRQWCFTRTMTQREVFHQTCHILPVVKWMSTSLMATGKLTKLTWVNFFFCLCFIVNPDAHLFSGLSLMRACACCSFAYASFFQLSIYIHQNHSTAFELYIYSFCSFPSSLGLLP